MSKKKAFSGSTMTLRDFHGGSIPSDLPLPSAPGMTAERSDRPGSGGRLSRGYASDRGGFLRQSSVNMARSLEDKASYFPNPANIGRNYDEDERKPVEGQNNSVSGVDEQPRSPLENRMSFSSSKSDGRVDSYTHEELGLIRVGHSAKPSQYGHDMNSLMGTSPEQNFIRSHSFQKNIEPALPWRQSNMLSPQLTGSGASVISSVQNVPTPRRDGDQNRTFSNDLSGNDVAGGRRTQTIASRIAQASALEKVSSGRWNYRSPNSLMEHPQDSIGEYSHFSGIHARHSADLGPQDYTDSDPGSYNAHVRASHTESITGLVPVSAEELGRPSLMQRSFSDNRYGNIPNRTSAEGWGDGSSSHQETIKNSSENFQVERFSDDNFGYGLTEIGRRGTYGNNNLNRHAAMGGITYSDLRRPKNLGVSPAVQYGDQQLNSSVATGAAYMDGRVLDSSKSFSSEYGRQGFSVQEQGRNMEYPYGYYSCNDSLGLHLSEVARGRPSGEEAAWSSSKSPYISDEVKHTRVNDRSKVLSNGDFEGGRLQNSRNLGSISSVNEVNTLPSLEVEGQSGIVERAKLSLLPRMKLLDVDHEKHGNWDAGIAQSTNTELQPGLPSASAVASVSTRSKPSDDGERIERPRLNLKPRSQTADIVIDSGSAKERMSVFGGARPRELVLKERGVDDSLIMGVKITSSSGAFESGQHRSSGGNRHKEQPRQDAMRAQWNENRGREKREDRWTADTCHTSEKREIDRPDGDKEDSWRRSVDSQKLSYGSPTPVSGVQPPRVPGRTAIASAAELAQAFSRSTSLGSGITRGYMGSPATPTPGSEDAKFSRLTEPISPAPRDVYISGVQGGVRRMNAY